jgi:hypothetical protein
MQESPRAVVLGVEFIPVPGERLSPDHLQSLWQWTDETVIDPPRRRRLLANGLRAGRVLRGDRVKARLDFLQGGEDVVDDFLSRAEIATDVSNGTRRIPMRVGQRYELPLRDPIPGSDVTLVRIGDEMHGRTLNEPQFLFAVTLSEIDAPRQVRLRLRPEIQHGSMRQRWVSSDSALRIDTRREAWSLETLDISLDVSEGDTVLVTGTAPAKGLGKQMLSGVGADQSPQQLIVLINVIRVPTIAETL